MREGEHAPAFDRRRRRARPDRRPGRRRPRRGRAGGTRGRGLTCSGQAARSTSAGSRAPRRHRRCGRPAPPADDHPARPRVPDLAGPGDLGGPPAAGLRPDHGDHRPPVHDPEPRCVRAAPADLRPVARHRRHPADDVHTARSSSGTTTTGSSRSRRTSSRRPKAWANPRGSAFSGSSCRSPSR